MGFGDGPDPLALGVFQAFRGGAEPGGNPLFAMDPFFQLVVGFHPSRLTSSLPSRPLCCRATPAECVPFLVNDDSSITPTTPTAVPAAEGARSSANRA